MDLPSFFTEAYNAVKSCTAPKKIPPTIIHKKAGSQPYIAAIIGPVTGPAPVIEENWWENTVNLDAGVKSWPSLYLKAGVFAFSSKNYNSTTN